MYVHAVESKPASTSKLLLFSVARRCVHYNLESKYYTPLKIRLCYTQGLWKFSIFEHAVIPSKLINRGWKYPLQNLGRGERTPLKKTRLGALQRWNWGKRTNGVVVVGFGIFPLSWLSHAGAGSSDSMTWSTLWQHYKVRLTLHASYRNHWISGGFCCCCCFCSLFVNGV